MLSLFSAIFTALLTIVGGYLLYEHQHLKNKRLEYYEKIFSELSESRYQLSLLVMRAVNAELNARGVIYEDLTSKALDNINSVQKIIPVAKVYISKESVKVLENTIFNLEKYISDAVIPLSLNAINDEESISIVFREIDPIIVSISETIDKLHLTFKNDISYISTVREKLKLS